MTKDLDHTSMYLHVMFWVHESVTKMHLTAHCANTKRCKNVGTKTNTQIKQKIQWIISKSYKNDLNNVLAARALH